MLKKIIVIITFLFFIIVSPANAVEKRSRSEITFAEDYMEDTVTNSEMTNSNIENKGDKSHNLLPKTNENDSNFLWEGYVLVGLSIYFIKKQRNATKIKRNSVDSDPIEGGIG